MTDPEDDPNVGFTTTPWDDDGIAKLEATGSNARSALAAGLRAVLTLAAAPSLAPDSAGRSAPIRGEGDDTASLFADMAEDLLGQIEFFGSGLHDVSVDGVLRREGGGYVGWGYASGMLDYAPADDVPRLFGTPTANEDDIRGVILRATLQRH